MFRKDLANTPDSGSERDTDTPATTSSPSRASWARLIKKLFEVDPVLCQNSAEENHIIFRVLSGAESRKNPFFIDFGRECDRNQVPPEIIATCQETGTPSLDVLHVREQKKAARAYAASL